MLSEAPEARWEQLRIKFEIVNIFYGFESFWLNVMMGIIYQK